MNLWNLSLRKHLKHICQDNTQIKSRQNGLPAWGLSTGPGVQYIRHLIHYIKRVNADRINTIPTLLGFLFHLQRDKFTYNAQDSNVQLNKFWQFLTPVSSPSEMNYRILPSPQRVFSWPSPINHSSQIQRQPIPGSNHHSYLFIYLLFTSFI